MKRWLNILIAPLRVISRPIALLAAALLLVGAWFLTVFLQTAQIEHDARDSLTVAASAVAAAVDAPLDRFADTTDAFRPPDFQSTDRVALTARLLRLQNALPTAGATFLLTAAGQLIAASAPFTSADAVTGDAPWFRRAIADNAMPLALQRVDGWLRPGPSVVLTRLVRDGSGRSAGLVGALLRLEDLSRLVGRSWLAPGISVELRGTDGATILPPAAVPAADHPDDERWSWGMPVMAAVNRLFGTPDRLIVAVPLHTVDMTVVAGMDARQALRNHWLGTRAVGILGAYLMAIWLTCLVLATAGRTRSERTIPTPVGFGADWQLELDPRGMITKVHGFAPDRLREAIGRRLPSALGLSEPSDAVRSIGEALDARCRLDSVEVPLVLPDGQERVYRLAVEPLPDGGFRCAGRDVTNEVRLAAQVETATAAAQAAGEEASQVTRDRDRILGALGHDVRTPMNSIMGICSLLLDSELENEQRIWLLRIRASCEALLAMLNGLLEIASGEGGGSELQLEEVDVIGLVQEVTDALAPQARDKGLELRTRYDDLLRGQWMVDPTRLRQVLFNLVGNAVKFTTSGHVEVRAAASETGDPATIKLAVSDTGPGIAPEDRSLIFERFKRGNHEGTPHQGLGLGLALCRENATLMGGELTVVSALGVGSEFTFTLPARHVPLVARNPLLAGRTTLLVGDENARARAIAAHLGEAGLLVETAPDGYLGLALAERMAAQRGALDLVVLQGSLAGMTAEAFVIRLRATGFGGRTIVLWLGAGGAGVEVDAIVPPPAEPYQVVATAKQLLTERSPIEVLDPTVSTTRGGRVLVVEDDKVNQALLVAALSRRGFAAFVANDGDEAVRLASHDSFDAILMDIQMPGRDGLEATQRIRALHGRAATIPIIAITGLQGPLTRKRCAEAGVTAVLEKPINLDRLGTLLRRWIPAASREAKAPSGALPAFDADVSLAFLEEMVAVVGIERARACVAEFVSEASARCMRLNELLPGWEAEAIIRSCEEISGLAETCGAVGLGEVLEEIADAVSRSDRPRAEALFERLEVVTGRLGTALTACLDDIARRWSGHGTRAA